MNQRGRPTNISQFPNEPLMAELTRVTQSVRRRWVFTQKKSETASPLWRREIYKHRVVVLRDIYDALEAIRQDELDRRKSRRKAKNPVDG